MEDSSPCTKIHFPFSQLNSPIQPTRKRQGKSFTNFLCKSLFFALFLIVLPLFPSQAPEFINQTILTKFWELLHLLFIGIAVSYGLIGRRNVEMCIDETHSNFDISQSYVSRMFHVASIFEDGFENPCGSGESSLIHSWDSQHIESEHITVCSNSSSGVEEKSKTRFLMSDNGFENPYGCDQKNVVQAWNSQYFQEEPMVVVAQPNYSLEEWGKRVTITDYKSLGLPVRSLKSRVRKLDSPEFISGSESGSVSKDSSSSDRSRGGSFGDFGHMNLEPSFNEAAAVASPIPWRTRSRRMEVRDKVGDVNRPSHFRPLSVDETQFESLKSRSFGSTGIFSSETSSISSPHTIPSELPNLSMEDLGKQKSFRRAFREAALHSRHYSIGSISGRDASRSSEDELKEWSSRRREDPLGSEECRMDSLKLNMNPASPTKASLRGKSVRTIRAGGLTARAMKNEERRQNQINDKAEKKRQNLDEAYMRKDKTKVGLDGLMIGSSKQDNDKFCPMPKATFSEYHNKEKEEYCKNVAAGSEEDWQSEGENFQVSSDECDVSGSVNDAGPYSDEVDKKADEFIAKFREQIMLQKMASIERSRGLQIGRNYFR